MEAGGSNNVRGQRSRRPPPPLCLRSLPRRVRGRRAAHLPHDISLDEESLRDIDAEGGDLRPGETVEHLDARVFHVPQLLLAQPHHAVLVDLQPAICEGSAGQRPSRRTTTAATTTVAAHATRLPQANPAHQRNWH